MDKEFILCAALNFNGSIICGHRHQTVIKRLWTLLKLKTKIYLCEIIKAF
jgi:hypothetical protein